MPLKANSSNATRFMFICATNKALNQLYNKPGYPLNAEIMSLDPVLIMICGIKLSIPDWVHWNVICVKTCQNMNQIPPSLLTPGKITSPPIRARQSRSTFAYSPTRSAHGIDCVVARPMGRKWI